MQLPHVQLVAYQELMAFSTELLPRENKSKELESALTLVTVCLGPVKHSLIRLVKFMQQLALFQKWLSAI